MTVAGIMFLVIAKGNPCMALACYDSPELS